jgi:hypothetical protein
MPRPRIHPRKVYKVEGRDFEVTKAIGLKKGEDALICKRHGHLGEVLESLAEPMTYLTLSYYKPRTNASVWPIVTRFKKNNPEREFVLKRLTTKKFLIIRIA